MHQLFDVHQLFDKPQIRLRNIFLVGVQSLILLDEYSLVQNFHPTLKRDKAQEFAGKYKYSSIQYPAAIKPCRLF